MKKIISVLLCLMLALSFASCRGKEVIQEMPTDEGATAVEQEVILYFPDENVFYLTEESRGIPQRDQLEKAIVEEVIKGPENEKLNKAIYGDVKVLSVETKDGLCTVDLSKEFATYNAGGSTQELMAIYSIVNSLCELETVDKVKINLEGASEWDFGGHFYMGEVLEFDKNIVKQ